MARKYARDLDYYPANNEYAENTTGSFGSGWKSGVQTGGFPGKDVAVAPSQFDTNGTPKIAGGKSLYPQGGKPMLNGMGPESPDQAQSRILGTNKVSPHQTLQQMLAQNDFDKRQGFQPTHSDEDIKRISDMVNPAKPASTTPVGNSQAIAAPGAAVLKNSNGDVTGTKSPLDALNNPPAIGAPITPQTGNALLGTVSGQDVPPAAPNAYATANAARIPGYSAGNPATATAAPDIAKLGSGFFGAIKRGAGNILTALNRPAATSQNPMAARAPTGAGDATAAGVSNASAAQFQKPTKENPVPVTPTTPTANIDKSQESLSRFGYSEDEFNKRKLAFAGF